MPHALRDTCLTPYASRDVIRLTSYVSRHMPHAIFLTPYVPSHMPICFPPYDSCDMSRHIPHVIGLLSYASCHMPNLIRPM